jgi:hypothetical protein
MRHCRAWSTGDRGHALVILGYTLSAENGRREEAKIASLCRVLGLGMRSPDELRVDIDVHGRCVIGGGVVLHFLRELEPPDALHCYRPNKLKRERGRGRETVLTV